MDANIRILANKFSPYQHIMITEKDTQTCLVLDGHFQTPLPNDGYYDIMLAPNIQNDEVAILGGGDLTCVPVLHRRGIMKWKMYELDKDVVDICKQFIPNKPKDLDKHIEYGDALVAMKDGKISGCHHIIVDLLGMNRLDALVDMSPTEFLDVLTNQNAELITGYTGGFTVGIMLNEFLKFEFANRKYPYFLSVYNEYEETFFYASTKPIIIPPRIAPMLVKYRVYPKNGDIMDYSLEDKLQIIREAF